MQAGQAVAVQNFHECLGSLILLAVYGALVAWQVPLMPTIVGFGVLVGVAMLAILALHRSAGAMRP